MKKLLFIIVTFCLFSTVQGQQFSFQMFFKDAAGNKDTLTLGYDLLATDSIDAAFGEKNIISVPLDTSLDVRITNEWINRYGYNKPGTYHTKKQITYNDCSYFDFNHIQTIDIYTRHWPVTVSWDNTIFNDDCRNGSVFTSSNPGDWWDVLGAPSNLERQKLTENGSVTFSSNAGKSFDEGRYDYVKDHDTIPVFWLALGNKYILYVSANELSDSENMLHVFPNPADENISVQVPLQFGTVKVIKIYSSTGQLAMTSTKMDNISIAQLVQGLYIVSITNENGNKLLTRMLKD